MTSQEPETPYRADQHSPDTEVIAVPEPAPVFVDSTGRRSRVLRGVALAFGVLVVAYGVLVSVSLAGGPVISRAVLPFPVFDEEPGDEKSRDRAAPRPTRTPPPSPSATTARPIVESATRNATGARSSPSVTPRNTGRTTKSPSPVPSPSRSSAVPSAEPVESATVSGQPQPGPGSPTPVKAPPPNATARPDSGGTGGGGTVPEPRGPATTPTAFTAAPGNRAAP